MNQNIENTFYNKIHKYSYSEMDINDGYNLNKISNINNIYCNLFRSKIMYYFTFVIINDNNFYRWRV